MATGVVMIDITARVMELSAQKYRCSQIMMIICLERLGRTNPDMVNAMLGLCNGFHCQETCGCLTGAACMLAMMQPQHSAALVPEMVMWFEGRYGSINCRDLIGEGRSNSVKCIGMVAAACGYCFETLAEKGLWEGED